MKVFVRFMQFLLLPFLTFAQETKKDSTTYLQSVTVYRSIKTGSVTGITNSAVIGEAVFKNYSPIDITSGLSEVPGVYVLSGALNTNRITIRGVGARTQFGTDKLRLYYNDIPVTNGTGFSTIEAFDLENLNAIEVIKGPKGTAFGANLGGAIILRTNDNSEENTRITNNFTVGSYGLFKNNVGFLHNEESFQLNLHYNHLKTNGYRENNTFDRDGILLTAAYRLKPNHSINFLFNQIDYTAQIPSSLSATAFQENPRQAAFTWKQAKGFEANKYTLLGLSYSLPLTENLKNTTSIFYTYLDHYEPRPFNILDEFTNGYGFRTQFAGDLKVAGKDAQYTFGAELYRDEYIWRAYDNLYETTNGNGSLQGDQISDNREYRRQFNAFTTFTVPLNDKFSAQLGININKTHYDFRDLFNMGAQNKNAKRNFDVIWLPSIDLEYRLTNTNRLYANISRGFSNPSLEETLTPDGVINPDIAQETGTNYELGAKLLFAQSKLSLQMALYQMNIKNLLVAQRVGEDQFIGRNAGSTKHRGIEINLDYLLNFNDRLSATPYIRYSFSDHIFVDFTSGNNDFSGNPLTGVPNQRLNTGIRLELNEGFYWNTSYHFVGEIPLNDANTLTSDVYGIFNTLLSYSKAISSKINLKVTVGINNIFASSYAQSVLINATGFGGNEPRYFYPGNGINYFGGVQISYAL